MDGNPSMPDRARKNVKRTVVTIRVATSGAMPPAGTPVIVEAQDTSLADAPARVVARARGVVSTSNDHVVATVSLSLEEPPNDYTIWVHIDVDRDGRISVGDFITMESFPLSGAVGRELTVRVRRVAS